jgi:hypothetical protein
MGTALKPSILLLPPRDAESWAGLRCEPLLVGAAGVCGCFSCLAVVIGAGEFAVLPLVLGSSGAFDGKPNMLALFALASWAGVNCGASWVAAGVAGLLDDGAGTSVLDPFAL